jgi:hypothetical protein
MPTTAPVSLRRCTPERDHRRRYLDAGRADAAIYVAQVEDDRLGDVVADGRPGIDA